MNFKKMIAVVCCLVLMLGGMLIVSRVGINDEAAKGTIEQRKEAAAEFIAEGRLKKAENTYKSILEENAGDSEARDALIDIYLKDENYSGAAEETRKTVMAQPASKEAYDGLIDLYQKSGETIEALDFIESIPDDAMRREYLDAAYDRTSENALVMGNTMGNLSNGGVLAFKDDMIFYCDVAKGNSLYRLQNGETKILCDGRISSLNVIGDYLYFVDQSRDYGIYKIKTDGTDFAKVGENIMATYLTIIGNRMYFINWMDNCKIYCMNMDGTGLTKVSDKSAEALYVHGTGIYVGDRDDMQSFYRIPLDGGSEQFILDSVVYFVCGYDNNIYFRAETEEGLRIYRMTTDGTAYDEVYAIRSGYLNADKGELFFVDFENGTLIKANEEGGEQKVLCKDGPNNISIDGDWVYYFSDYNDKKLYRIRKDGTGRECLN